MKTYFFSFIRRALRSPVARGLSAILLTLALTNPAHTDAAAGSPCQYNLSVDSPHADNPWDDATDPHIDALHMGPESLMSIPDLSQQTFDTGAYSGTFSQDLSYVSFTTDCGSYELQLFDQTNFQGDVRAINVTTWLSEVGFNDKARSARVVERSEPLCQALFYENTKFNPRHSRAVWLSTSAVDGILEVADIDHWKDQFSSMLFVGSCQSAAFVLYDHPDFQGDALMKRASDLDMAIAGGRWVISRFSDFGWNDRASSIRIIFAPLATDFFDATWYLDNHLDLKSTFGDDLLKATQHWLEHGLDEGRQSNAEFSIRAYRNRYQDLHGHSYNDALGHWKNHGQSEGRNAAPIAPFSMDWTLVDGNAIDIGAGADGSVWCIGTDMRVYRYTGSDWEDMDFGNALRIDAAPDGSAWVVRNDGQVWHLLRGDQIPVWQLPVAVAADAMDIGIGADGTVWFTSPEGKIYRYYKNDAEEGWEDMFGTAQRIDVDNDGVARVVQENGAIWHYNGSPGSWTQSWESATDIGIGADGTIWITHTNGSIYRWNTTESGWQKSNGTAAQISAGQNGIPWVVQTNTQIWHGTAQ